jgi:hypothetical protein
MFPKKSKSPLVGTIRGEDTIRLCETQGLAISENFSSEIFRRTTRASLFNLYAVTQLQGDFAGVILYHVKEAVSRTIVPLLDKLLEDHFKLMEKTPEAEEISVTIRYDS